MITEELQQLYMVLYRLFDPLRLNADTSLGGCDRTMLQKLLYQCDIEAIGFVYACITCVTVLLSNVKSHLKTEDQTIDVRCCDR